MITWLRRLYFLYSVSLPGLGISAIIAQDLAILNVVNQSWFSLVLLLGLIPLATYLVFATEIVPFPRQLPGALFTVFFIPIELALALVWDNVSLWNIFIIQIGSELLGVMGLIAILVIKKQMSSERNWFNASILLIGSACALLFSYTVLLPALPIGRMSYIATAAATIGIGVRYYVYLKSPHRNSGDFSTVFIVIGLALTCVLPLLTWILINAAALSAQLSA